MLHQPEVLQAFFKEDPHSSPPPGKSCHPSRAGPLSPEFTVRPPFLQPGQHSVDSSASQSVIALRVLLVSDHNPESEAGMDPEREGREREAVAAHLLPCPQSSSTSSAFSFPTPGLSKVRAGETQSPHLPQEACSQGRPSNPTEVLLPTWGSPGYAEGDPAMLCFTYLHDSFTCFKSAQLSPP